MKSAADIRVMMAVPQYPYPVVGGLERQAHELAKALIALGSNVQAVSGRIESGQATREFVEEVLVYRIPWSRHKALRFVRTPFDLFAVLYGQRETYDVVHLHQFSWFAIFTILIARLLGKPVLTKLPGVQEFGLPGLARSYLGKLKLKVFRSTDAVVAMSGESIAELAAIGFPMGRVLATPNGIRLSAKDRVKPPSSPDTACRVVYVGRLSSEKNIDDLLYAWRDALSSTKVAAVLELWGTGPAAIDLRHLSDQLRLAESVVFRGHVNSVREHLPAMDVFVLPSSLEGNSNAILEAMAAGLPVVSTQVGGTPMLVGTEGAEFLVTPGDRAGLAARLIALIGDAELRTKVGDAMLARIHTHFEITHVARTYKSAYALLAAGRRDEVMTVSNPIVMGLLA